MVANVRLALLREELEHFFDLRAHFGVLWISCEMTRQARNAAVSTSLNRHA
jgi:hypothetical protein